MSVVFYVLLLLLLLGFSFHACGARAFGVVDDHRSISKEIDEKLNPEARVSTPPMPNDAARDEGDDDQKVEIESDDHDLDLEKTSDTLEGESLAPVRWRVPHRKKGEAEPGFNLDYLPPKTHPPSHN